MPRAAYQAAGPPAGGAATHPLFQAFHGQKRYHSATCLDRPSARGAGLLRRGRPGWLKVTTDGTHAWWLVALLGVAGCAAPPAAVHPGPVPVPPQEPAAFSYANDGTHCQRYLMMLPLDKARLQSLLPPGFHARDAGDSLVPGLPEAGLTGQGLGLLQETRCQGSKLQPLVYDEATAGIVVEAPRVAGVTPTAENVYELGRAAADGAMTENMSAIGWPRMGDGVKLQTYVYSFFFVLPSSSVQAEVKDVNGSVVRSYASGFGDPVPQQVETRSWHMARGGLAWFDYKYAVQVLPNTSGSCSVRGPSIAYTLVGGPACPRDSLYLTGLQYNFAGRFEYHPGLKADA